MTRSDAHLAEYHGYSPEHWAGLSERDRALYALIRPTPGKFYACDVQVTRLESWVAENKRDMQGGGGDLEMEPVFQRGHVWSDAQRSAYCESFVRGQAAAQLQFNCPSYHDIIPKKGGDIPPMLMQCVDGLQRYTALTRYVNDEVTVFGGLKCSELKGPPFDATRHRINVRVYGFLNQADLLDFYLDSNSGGTPHSAEELVRVRALRDNASAPATAPRKRPTP